MGNQKKQALEIIIDIYKRTNKELEISLCPNPRQGNASH